MAVALYMVVEGDTEERFANQVLIPHLINWGVCAYASKVVTKGQRGGASAQGGGRTYRAWKDDLTRWIKQQRHRSNVWFTTMLDLYGLGSFADGFPGYELLKQNSDPYQRADGLELAWANDIGFERFIPHLQVHEFEALLLVDVTFLKAEFIEHGSEIDLLLAEIVESGKAPELINDSKLTAPSKRIIRHVPAYDSRKASAGASVAKRIGLPRLREACPHFDKWLHRLEQLGVEQA